MKVICEKSYHYVGVSDGKWYVFEKHLSGQDPERVMVQRCRFVKEDGSYEFYDPICSTGGRSVVSSISKRSPKKVKLASG